MIKVLLIIILVFLVLRALGKIVVVTSFRNMANYQANREKETFEQHKKNEGKITIDKVPSGKNYSDGDYVDFEEVK